MNPPDRGRAHAPGFERRPGPCRACADGDDATVRLVRAAFDEDVSSSPAIPEELVQRILAARDGTMAGLVSLLAGLAASPLLAFSIGL